MRDGYLEPGDPVIAVGGDEDPDFAGHIIAPNSGGTFAYYQDGRQMNIPVFGVEDRATGEVRFFRGTSLRYDGSD